MPVRTAFDLPSSAGSMRMALGLVAVGDMRPSLLISLIRGNRRACTLLRLGHDNLLSTEWIGADDIGKLIKNQRADLTTICRRLQTLKCMISMAKLPNPANYSLNCLVLQDKIMTSDAPRYREVIFLE